MKRILMVGGAEPSASLVIEKIEAAAKSRNIEVELFLMGEFILESTFENWDVILLAPQVRALLPKVIKTIAGTDVKLGMIEPEVYQGLDGERILDQALAL